MNAPGRGLGVLGAQGATKSRSCTPWNCGRCWSGVEGRVVPPKPCVSGEEEQNPELPVGHECRQGHEQGCEHARGAPGWLLTHGFVEALGLWGALFQV